MLSAEIRDWLDERNIPAVPLDPQVPGWHSAINAGLLTAAAYRLLELVDFTRLSSKLSTSTLLSWYNVVYECDAGIVIEDTQFDSFDMDGETILCNYAVPDVDGTLRAVQGTIRLLFDWRRAVVRLSQLNIAMRFSRLWCIEDGINRRPLYAGFTSSLAAAFSTMLSDREYARAGYPTLRQPAELQRLRLYQICQTAAAPEAWLLDCLETLWSDYGDDG